MTVEMRLVPVHWEHPKEKGKGTDLMVYNPLRGDFEEAMQVWESARDLWTANEKTYATTGTFTNLDGETEKADPSAVPTWKSYAGEMPTPPEKQDFIPSGEWHQLYETATAGTPLTPPFATTVEIDDWLAVNKDFMGHQ